MLREAQAAWRQRSPFAWEMIRLRGLLMAPPAENGGVLARPAQRPSLWHHLALLLIGRRWLRARV